MDMTRCEPPWFWKQNSIQGNVAGLVTLGFGSGHSTSSTGCLINSQAAVSSVIWRPDSRTAASARSMISAGSIGVCTAQSRDRSRCRATRWPPSGFLERVRDPLRGYGGTGLLGGGETPGNDGGSGAGAGTILDGDEVRRGVGGRQSVGDGILAPGAPRDEPVRLAESMKFGEFGKRPIPFRPAPPPPPVDVGMPVKPFHVWATTGRPATGRKSLSTSGPMRVRARRRR